MIESRGRIIDLEGNLRHSHSESSLQSDATSITLSSSAASLEKGSRSNFPSLPPKQYARVVRRLRYTIWAVYQRLFTLIFTVNLAAVLTLLHLKSWNTSVALNLDNLATLASSNFFLAILFRQDWLINLLFRSAWLIPWSLPLRLRRLAGRVYCYGGIHSGAAVVGTLWWIFFSAVMSWKGVSMGIYTPLVLILTLIIASLLITIIILSLPRLRVRHHDTWELTHRFLGWLSIALFWTQLLLLTQYSSTPDYDFTHRLIDTPTFWSLAIMTLLLIYPWLRLRRWTFTATPLSNHALQLSFPNTVHKYSCLALSSSPLKEWHPFATFPSTDRSKPGASMVVSAAGDWTRHLITTAQQSQRAQELSCSEEKSVQMRFWIKSHPRAGVLSLSCLYKRVVIVTTGSGIGPSLSSLLDCPQNQVARLVWSTRSPQKTYGEGIMRLVAQADPDALVLDTDASGRPDLLQVAWRMYVETQAEAVFVLSNEKVTRLVVGGLEKRGIPAYGPIWDS